MAKTKPMATRMDHTVPGWINVQHQPGTFTQVSATWCKLEQDGAVFFGVSPAVVFGKARQHWSKAFSADLARFVSL